MGDRSPDPGVPSLRGKLVRGTAWMVVSRWVVRFIGVFNTAILARLLAPADFGIVAMCMIVVGLLEVLFTLGIESVLLQQEEVSDERWNTAWTLKILQGIAVSLLILAATPFAVRYFDEPRIATVLPFLTLGILFQSFENIGIVAFRRDLDFRKDFLYLVLRKVVAVAVTIVLAVTLRNYWALAIGIVTGQGLMMVLSYVLHPYRPRLTLAAFRDLWSHSQYMLLAHIAWYVQGRCDEFIVGGRYDTRQFGTYTVSSEVAELPSSELLLPMMRALLPGFSRLQGERSRLAASYLNVLGVSATVGLALGIGVALVAEDIVPILLGPQWADAPPLLELLAIYGTFRLIYGNVGTVMVAVGKYRALAWATWGHTILLVGGLVAASRFGNLREFCLAKAGFGFCFMMYWFVHLTRTLPVTARDIRQRLTRPALAAVAMAAAVLALRPHLPGSAVASLLLSALAGAVVYLVVLLGAWRAAGRPDGAERFLLEVLESRVFSRFRRGRA